MYDVLLDANERMNRLSQHNIIMYRISLAQQLKTISQPITIDHSNLTTDYC